MDQSSTLKIGAWTFDPDRRRLTNGSAERRISPKAAAVLSALADADGGVCTRDMLLDQVWPTVTVGEEVLTHAISELRRALGDQRGAAQHIETIPKHGYRLACLVQHDQETTLALPGLAKALPASISLNGYTTYLAAYDTFERGGLTSLTETMTLLRASMDESPGFAPATALLATTLAHVVGFYGGGRDQLNEALAVSQMALELDPRCAEALCARGLALFCAGSLDQAKQACLAALAVDSASFDAHYYLGRICIMSGEFETAALLLDRAARLGGDDYHCHHLAASALRGLGRHEEAAIRQKRAGIALGLSSHFGDNSVRGIVTAAACHMAQGEVLRARELAEGLAQRPEAARRIVALTYARTGMFGEALDMLQDCTDQGSASLGWVSGYPEFVGLRAEPRFRRLERVPVN